ncbi:uncharacterized protein LOC131032151 [Cryptomeria japonica]|uniref:uncharacterized protein LOC131032151 n=1 Tax=Cryptomeria japonica TaxID=3369 RepID=UPI0027DA45F4|nr:uncharacterized protein LOC131032151 [Cryptomeria japonica]XP_057819066.2 uncharacterized protein LOC131032151 [Cryptomeria japonica]
MEQIIGPLLNFIRIPPMHRTSRAHARGVIGQLLSKLEGYSADFDRDPKLETAAAETLVKCLYHERFMLLEVEAREYIKILRLLWEFEDQGYIVPSSLINDLAIQTLLETCQDIKCKSIVTSSLQHMFITATYQNKRVLVDAVLLSALGHNARNIGVFDLWENAIIASIGKSSMRMAIVESSLLEKCTNDHLIGSSAKQSLLQCIASTMPFLLFDWNKIRAVVIQRMHVSEEKTAIAYARFLHALAKLEDSDPIHYINEFIVFLKTAKSAEMDLQCSIYKAIDDLKKKMRTNVYQEPFFKIFSEQWGTNEQQI